MHGTMHGNRTGRVSGWIGVLLLLAQLAAGVLLPVLHAGLHETGPDRVAAAGNDLGGHGDACVICRHADLRSHLLPADSPPVALAEHVAAPLLRVSMLAPPSRLLAATAPRGPPAA
jgi:hypothetical protein